MPAPAGAGRPGPPTVIDVGAISTKHVLAGTFLLLGLGGLAVVSGLVGAVAGGAGVRITAIAIGAVFVLLGLLPIIKRRKVFRPRKLIVEQQGIRWDDPEGTSWAIPWAELSAVSINKHGKLEVGPQSVNDRIVGAATEKLTGENVFVRVDLYPADPGFRSRHPQLEHLWEFQDVKNGYRLPLGRNPGYIPLLAQAMAYFAPQVYRGVRTTEGFMGLA